jgi:hypothetical protein
LNRVMGGEGCWSVNERIPKMGVILKEITLAAYTSSRSGRSPV